MHAMQFLPRCYPACRVTSKPLLRRNGSRAVHVQLGATWCSPTTRQGSPFQPPTSAPTCSNRLGKRCSRASLGSSQPTNPDGSGSGSIQKAAAVKPNVLQRLLHLLRSVSPKAELGHLLKDTFTLLKRYGWALILLFLARDALQFALHRVTHRLTNMAAEAVFEYPISSMVINPWWLVLDAEFLEQHSGYQIMMVLFFLIALPLNLLLNCGSSAIMMLLCTKQSRAQAAQAGQAHTIQPTDTANGTQTSSPRSLPNSPASTPTTTPTNGSTPCCPPALPTLSDSTSTSASSPPASTNGSSTLVASASSETPTSASTQPAASTSSNGKDLVSPRRPAAVADAKGTLSSSFPLTSPSSSASAVERAKNGIPVAGSRGSSKSGLTQDSNAPSSTSRLAAPTPSSFPPASYRIKGPRHALSELRSVLPEVWVMMGRIWWVELLASGASLGLQGLMTLIIPIFWALPLLLSIQLTLAGSVLKGWKGLDALRQSHQTMQGYRPAYFWPFATLLLAIRIVDTLRAGAFALMPNRYWTDAIEIPIAVYVLIALLRFMVSRLQDLLPLAAFLRIDAAKAQQPPKDGLADAKPTPAAA